MPGGGRLETHGFTDSSLLCYGVCVLKGYDCRLWNVPDITVNHQSSTNKGLIDTWTSGLCTVRGCIVFVVIHWQYCKMLNCTCSMSAHTGTSQACRVICDVSLSQKLGHFIIMREWATLIGMNKAPPPTLYPVLIIHPCPKSAWLEWMICLVFWAKHFIDMFFYISETYAIA